MGNRERELADLAASNTMRENRLAAQGIGLNIVKVLMTKMDVVISLVTADSLGAQLDFARRMAALLDEAEAEVRRAQLTQGVAVSGSGSRP